MKKIVFILFHLSHVTQFIFAAGKQSYPWESNWEKFLSGPIPRVVSGILILGGVIGAMLTEDGIRKILFRIVAGIGMVLLIIILILSLGPILKLAIFILVFLYVRFFPEPTSC